MVDFVAVIPARMESSRLPGKPLADICGRPMVLWVADRARLSRASEVVVATDSEEIAAACEAAGVSVEMTSKDHASGTDRIAELAVRRGWSDEHIIVNVQGDEPLLPPVLIDQVADLLAGRPDADIATLQAPIDGPTLFLSPDTAKVISNDAGEAIYFSRAPIPAGGEGVPDCARRHIGMYAYRCSSLRALAAAPRCEIEKRERLEQLRALWLGQTIIVADAQSAPAQGVDTPADLDQIRELAVADPHRQWKRG